MKESVMKKSENQTKKYCFCERGENSMDVVIFHARLAKKDNPDRKIIIKEDKFEERLVMIPIAAGVKKENIVIS